METVGKGEIDFAALGVDPDAEVTLKRKPLLYGTPEQPSEGIGELIERLCVAVFKGGFGSEQAERLSKILGEPLAEAIANLAQCNKALFDLKNEQAAAVGDKCQEAEYLLDLLRRDINLCKSRATIRAEINRRLGGAVSGESVKNYSSGIGPFGNARDASK